MRAQTNHLMHFFRSFGKCVFGAVAYEVVLFWRWKGTACFFSAAVRCLVFLIAKSWMGVFFDGETGANVFFHTFELFDTMHAIQIY